MYPVLGTSAATGGNARKDTGDADSSNTKNHQLGYRHLLRCVHLSDGVSESSTHNISGLSDWASTRSLAPRTRSHTCTSKHANQRQATLWNVSCVDCAVETVCIRADFVPVTDSFRTQSFGKIFVGSGVSWVLPADLGVACVLPFGVFGVRWLLLLGLPAVVCIATPFRSTAPPRSRFLVKCVCVKQLNSHIALHEQSAGPPPSYTCPLNAMKRAGGFASRWIRFALPRFSPCQALRTQEHGFTSLDSLKYPILMLSTSSYDEFPVRCFLLRFTARYVSCM